MAFRQKFCWDVLSRRRRFEKASVLLWNNEKLLPFQYVVPDLADRSSDRFARLPVPCLLPRRRRSNATPLAWCPAMPRPPDNEIASSRPPHVFEEVRERQRHPRSTNVMAIARITTAPRTSQCVISQASQFIDVRAGRRTGTVQIFFETPMK
jgi:hypothetical protein